MKNYCLSLSFLAVFLSVSAQDFQFPKMKGTTVGLDGTTIMVDQGAASVSDWLAYAYNTLLADGDEGFTKENIDNLMPDTNVLPDKYRFMIRMFYRLINHHTSDKEYSLEYFIGSNLLDPGLVIVGQEDRMFYLPITAKEKEKGGVKDKLDKYLQLPIVAISYNQVQGYLEWRMELESRLKSVERLKEKGYNLKEVRMLTIDERKKFASDFGPHFAENHTSNIDTINKEGCYLLNIKVDKPCPSVLEGRKVFGEGTVGVFSYNPDRRGLYCIYGNVAEMTDVSGIATGASYLDYGNACKADRTISYSGPQPWLGFRTVLEFSKKN